MFLFVSSQIYMNNILPFDSVANEDKNNKNVKSKKEILNM